MRFAHIVDIVVTRRNDRHLTTTNREPVRNRETWAVAAIPGDGALTVIRQHGTGSVTLPADYTREHVRLGYAATEHGWQADTVTAAISLTTAATTCRGLYVAATRGRERNELCVVTGSDDLAEARDILDSIVAHDRADTPAITQRRTLAQRLPPTGVVVRQPRPVPQPSRTRRHDAAAMDL